MRHSLRRPFIRAGKYFLRAIGRFQGRHSLVSAEPFIPNAQFSWAKRLEAAWPAIRAEFDAVWKNPDDIPAFHQMSPDQQRISKGDNWKTFAFYVYGRRVEENCTRCPRTAAALDGLPGMRTAMFSILAPRYHIPPHKGPTRAVVRCHLALRVPAERERCWIRVDEQTYAWTEGHCVFFDDTYEHEVRNDTGEHRAVLFIDIDRPSDRLGTWFNRAIVGLISASTYVKLPLKNLEEWNRTHRQGR